MASKAITRLASAPLRPALTSSNIPAFQLRTATTSQLNSSSTTSTPPRRAVTIANDTGRVPWSQLSIGEKAARTTQQTANLGLILLGLGLTGGVATVLYLEVISPSSKTAIFNKAADRVKRDARCIELLADQGHGREIEAHGEGSWSRWARNRYIASHVETDKVGTEHLYMHFYVEGPKNRGTVNVHMTKGRDGGDWEWYHLALDVPGHERIWLENVEKGRLDNRAKGKMFGVKWCPISHKILTAANNSPVIPQSRCTKRPLKPDLDIDVTLVNLVQVLEDDNALRFIKSEYPHRHLRVHPQRFPFSRRVHPDDRMYTLDVLRSSIRIVTVQIGVRRALHCVTPVYDLTEFRRQLLIRAVPTCLERVIANVWDSIVMEVRNAGWLALMDTSRCQNAIARTDELREEMEFLCPCMRGLISKLSRGPALADKPRLSKAVDSNPGLRATGRASLVQTMLDYPAQRIVLQHYEHTVPACRLRRRRREIRAGYQPRDSPRPVHPRFDAPLRETPNDHGTPISGTTMPATAPPNAAFVHHLNVCVFMSLALGRFVKPCTEATSPTPTPTDPASKNRSRNTGHFPNLSPVYRISKGPVPSLSITVGDQVRILTAVRFAPHFCNSFAPPCTDPSLLSYDRTFEPAQTSSLRRRGSIRSAEDSIGREVSFHTRRAHEQGADMCRCRRG
ncbi:mitochondrial import inner membrane translocase subunit tim21 [Zalaria obscura]|uniref:Mitochondrial import inner membrane translocase subunit tim21 n=1 Tax=Zalaria obscura TaxID=2024903 RepID=A0ACC3SFA2_9PEZI